MKTYLFSVLALAAVPALAQHSHHGSHHENHARMPSHQGHSAYAGMQTRAIKSLSPQQVADLRAGKGMGFAMAAELNGYPGPLHTLELADELALGDEQKLQITRLYKEMQREAQAGGELLIERETELDRLFKEKKATSPAVEEAAVKAAHAHGLLRAVHLKYHLAIVEILTPEQIAKYNRLRGY